MTRDLLMTWWHLNCGWENKGNKKLLATAGATAENAVLPLVGGDGQLISSFGTIRDLDDHGISFLGIRWKWRRLWIWKTWNWPKWHKMTNWKWCNLLYQRCCNNSTRLFFRNMFASQVLAQTEMAPRVPPLFLSTALRQCAATTPPGRRVCTASESSEDEDHPSDRDCKHTHIYILHCSTYIIIYLHIRSY